MVYNLANIELSLNDEIMLKSEIEKRAVKSGEGNLYYFEKAIEGYKNFDFSTFSEFDKYEVDDVRDKFQSDSALSSRPLLFIMYIMNRNGFIDNYFQNKKRVINICNPKLKAVDMPNNIPEAIVTEDGMLYGIGRDGHIWLYNFLNLSGIETRNCLRYSNFTDPDTNKRNQFFSKLKEFDGDKKPLYLTEQQAIVLNNLRKKYEPLTSLQNLLLNCTANLGFRVGDSMVALKINFDTFANAFPEEHMDRSEIIQIRKTRDIIAQKGKI